MLTLTLTLTLALALALTLILTPLNPNICAHIVDTLNNFFSEFIKEFFAEVPGHIVLDGNLAPLPQRGRVPMLHRRVCGWGQ